MNGKILTGLMLLFFLMGCAAMEPIEVREKTYGKGIPVITQSFASPKLYPGDTWKVYLKASDPDRDMRNIVCMIEQPGVGVYPLSYIRIGDGNRKEFSGFITLNTAGIRDLDFVHLKLTVQVQDMAGHVSEPAVYPLSFNPRFTQEPPPLGVFLENDLGPIMIKLRSPFEDGVKIED